MLKLNLPQQFIEFPEFIESPEFIEFATDRFWNQSNEFERSLCFLRMRFEKIASGYVPIEIFQIKYEKICEISKI